MRGLLLTSCVVLGFASASLANETSATLLAMTEQARNARLTEMIKPSGEPCDAVVRSMHMRDNPDGSSSWSVECRDKNSYALGVFPNPRPHTSVLSCDDLKLLARAIASSPGGIPVKEGAECFKK